MSTVPAPLDEHIRPSLCVLQWSAEERKAFNEQLLLELRQQGHVPRSYVNSNEERRRVIAAPMSASGAAAARKRGAAVQQAVDAREREAARGQVPAGYRRARRLPGHVLPVLHEQMHPKRTSCTGLQQKRCANFVLRQPRRSACW